MGRLFDTKEPNKTSATPNKTKGRLYTAPIVKKTLGEKVLNTGTAVSTFFGGKAVADKIGAKIAKAGATEEEKKYITEPTNKQVLASAGELALNTVGMLLSGGAGAAAKGVNYARLAAEGAAYGGSQATLRAVQDQKSGKEVLRDAAIGTGIGAIAGPVVGRIFRGKVSKPTLGAVEDAVPNVPVQEAAPTVEKSAPTLEFTQRAPEATEDVRTTMTNLEKGYNKKQVTQIMGILGKNNPTGRYTPAEISEVASKFKQSGRVPKGIVVNDRGPMPSVAPIEKPQIIPTELQQGPVVKPVVTERPPTPTVKDPIRALEESSIDDGADPIIKKTTFEEQRGIYDAVSSNTTVDDLIDMSMGKKPLPEGLQKNTVYELTKNRLDLSPEQVRRLANTAPESEAGLNLVLTKLRQGGIIDNPTDMIKVVEKQMKEKATKNSITKKTIKRFLDDIGCTM